MVPQGEFSSVLLLSSPRNSSRCPDEFKRTGPFRNFFLEKVFQGPIRNVINPNFVVQQQNDVVAHNDCAEWRPMTGIGMLQRTVVDGQQSPKFSPRMRCRSLVSIYNIIEINVIQGVSLLQQHVSFSNVVRLSSKEYFTKKINLF